MLEASQEHCAFDVWNEVPLVPQLTGMSCWAAAAAMLVGWRDRVPVDSEEVAAGAGHWGAYRDGLLPDDLEALAAAWGLEIEPHLPWTAERLRARLEQVGPLWMGEASPGLHSIVVTGMFGDARGMFVRIADPWPVGRGERYVLPFATLMRNFRAATEAVGVHPQVLHTGGRGRGSSRRWNVTERTRTQNTATTSSWETQAIMETHVESNSRRSGFGRTLMRPLTLVSAGQRYLASSVLSVDPLRSHGGSGENLFLRWNALDSTATAVDVVVHFHGYRNADATRAMLAEKVGVAGVDLAGRTRPTLVIVPRGRRITEAEIAAARARGGDEPNPGRYTFGGLERNDGEGLEQLVAGALAWFGREVLGAGAPAVDRLILTAHSGGGAALNRLLRSHATRRVCNPHEVHVFDAVYLAGGVQGDGIASWARARITADAAVGRGGVRPDMATAGGGLRVLYGNGTRRGSEWIGAQLGAADLIGGSASALARWYRCEYAGEDHNGIPRSHGPHLLADVSMDLTLGGSRSYGTPLGLFRAMDQMRSGTSSARRVAVALVDHNSPQPEQSTEIRRRVARSVGIAEAGGRFDLVHDDSNRVNFGIGSWTGSRIATVLDTYVEVATELGTVAALHRHFGGEAAFNALRERFRANGTAATASTAERTALQQLGADTSLQEAQIRQLARDVEADLRVVGSQGDPWYPFIDGGMGAISELAAHVLVHARHQAGNGLRTVLRRAIDHFGGDDALGRAMVAGTVTERDFLERVGEEVALRVQERYREGVRNRYRRLLRDHAASDLAYYFDPVVPQTQGLASAARRVVRPLQLDWCQLRYGIIRSAVEEQGFWLLPNGSLRTESDPQMLANLEAYWRDGAGLSASAAQAQARLSAADDVSAPWSAAFVSWCVRNAGVPNNVGFEFGPRHILYIVGALRNREAADRARPFWLFQPTEPEGALIAGDIVCKNRRVDGVWTTHSYASLKAAYWDDGHQNVNPTGSSHTDIVIGFLDRGGRRYAELIGGNVGNTAGTTLYEVDANNRLVNAAGDHVFGIIRLLECPDGR